MHDAPLPALKFYAVSRGYQVAELRPVPAVGAARGATAAYRVRNPEAIRSQVYRLVLVIPTPADGINAGAPLIECDCGLQACAHTRAVLEFRAGPLAPPDPPAAARAAA